MRLRLLPLLARYGERDPDLERDLVHDLCRRGDPLPFSDAEGELALGGRSTLVPLRGGFDAVAFVSEPDSMISPSEGVDGELDLRRDAMLSTYRREDNRPILPPLLAMALFRPLEEASMRNAQLAQAPGTK